MADFYLSFVFPLFTFLIAYAIAERRSQKPLGWCEAWVGLTGMGGVFRILLDVMPDQSVLISRAVLSLGAALGLAFLIRKRDQIRSRSDWYSVPFLIAGVFVFLRNCFPQFDVDSIAYHHTALSWFRYRSHMPPVLQDFRLTDLRYHTIGTEEFLAVPGLGKELMLYGGVLGGVFKWLSVLSVASICPRPFVAGRYLILLLLLVDDHFFFSGSNTFVYVNPTLIGIFALGAWATWRAARGSYFYGPVAVAMAVCGAVAKMYGLFTAVVYVPIAVVAFFLAARRKKPVFDFRYVAILGAFCFLGAWAVYGLNTWQTGTPFYPYPFGPFSANVAFDKHFDNFANAKPFLTYLREDKHKLITYSGNLALKMATVLFLPTLFASLFWRFFPAVLRKRLSRRGLRISVWTLAAGIAWCLLLAVMYYEEARYHGRYARHIMGVVAVGLSWAFIAVRKLIPLAAPRWNALRRLIVLAGGFGVVGYLVLTVDTRYFNIVSANRPNWSEIGRFMWTDRRSSALAGPPYNRMLEPFSRGFLPMIADCYAKESGEVFSLTADDWDPRFATVIHGGPKAWPGSFAVPLALRLDPFVSVRVEGPAGAGVMAAWLKQSGLRYLIAREGEDGRPVPGYSLRDGLWNSVRDKNNPICRADGVVVYRLSH